MVFSSCVREKSNQSSHFCWIHRSYSGICWVEQLLFMTGWQAVVCLLCCLNHFTVRSVPSGRHWYQLVCGLVRLPGCQSIRNCQPSGKMRSCIRVVEPDLYSDASHVDCEDAWFLHGCLLPPALPSRSQPCRQVPVVFQERGSAHSLQCRHRSVTLAHVSPARKCRSKKRHGPENKSAESRAFCYLSCPLRLGVEMGLQWERKAEDLFLVKDGDKNPPHCEAFFSCM